MQDSCCRIMASADKPTSRSRALLWLVLLANVGLLLYYVSRYRPPQHEMESLAGIIIDTGEVSPRAPRMLRMFGLPDDDAKFCVKCVVSESGRGTAIQVRQRKGSGDVDVFLIDILRNGEGENYYLTGTHGRLAKSVFLDSRSKVAEVADAAKRFEIEKEVWMLWRRDVLKQWALVPRGRYSRAQLIRLRRISRVPI